MAPYRQTANAPLEPAAIASPTKASVLLVDDRPDGLLAMEAVISSLENVEVFKAGSGREALAMIYERHFAVILLDVQMPEMDGFETARLIRQYDATKTTPIIFVTAISKETHHISRGYESGAVDYIFKPFDPFILRSKVRVFAELYLSEQQVKEQAKALCEWERREKERRVEEAERSALSRYKTLADTVPLGVTKIISGETDYTNDAWSRYTGLHPEDRSSSWKQAVHPEDLDSLLLAMSSSESSGHFETECRLRRTDSEYRWQYVRATRYRENNAWIWLLTWGDVHDHHEAMERLHRLNAELLRSNQELEQFTYIASHDLQEPLRKIITFAERIDGTPLDEGQKEAFLRISNAAYRMKKVIEDLLQFSRVTKSHLGFEEISLKEIVHDVLADLEMKIQESGARVTISALPRLHCNRSQMRHLFQNLLTNSIKFARKDVPPSVEVGCREGNGFHELFVRDNGIGFDEKYKDKIFEPFQRLHARGEYEGTGIGLSIVRKIVQYHGGYIRAVSRPGEGATFMIAIPAGKPAPVAA